MPFLVATRISCGDYPEIGSARLYESPSSSRHLRQRIAIGSSARPLLSRAYTQVLGWQEYCGRIVQNGNLYCHDYYTVALRRKSCVLLHFGCLEYQLGSLSCCTFSISFSPHHLAPLLES